MQELGNGLSKVGPHDLADNPLFESVSRVENDLNDLIGALSLLGVKRCSQCRQFFRSAEPGALFDCGQIVCYKCIPDWWSSLSRHLGVTDRERTEGKLASWLRKYHGAEVVKETPDRVSDTGYSISATAYALPATQGLTAGVAPSAIGPSSSPVSSTSAPTSAPSPPAIVRASP